MFGDPGLFADLKRKDLLVEARSGATGGSGGRPAAPMRHVLARPAFDWPTGLMTKRYLQRPESGRVDWFARAE